MRKTTYTPVQQTEILVKLSSFYKKDILSNQEIIDYINSNKLSMPYFIFRDESRKRGRGMYSLHTESEQVASVDNKVVALQPKKIVSHENFIPETDPTYVGFGFYESMVKIISSGVFYPIYVTGMSGNGKTMMITQACAHLGREIIRVNITKRTDETDLIGSYELIDGDTVRREGPVITAMRRGAVLLLDETDLGTEDILCLQPILEGKPYFDKKTGEVVHPAKGFNVIATANTKGKGSDDGRFIGTNVLNEAFLERFAITVEQEYPPENIEVKILENNFKKLDTKNDKAFIKNLVRWSNIIRTTFDEGGVTEIVSTRRLVHIITAYVIFGDKLKALEYCLNRFDTDTKIAFLDFYTKIDNLENQTKTDNTATDKEEVVTPF